MVDPDRSADPETGTDSAPDASGSATAFGSALRDHYLGERSSPLLARDGMETREHPIEEFYFEAVDPADGRTRWLERHLEGPLVDLGAGVGRDTLYFQGQFETVAIEITPELVETMADRGVETPVHGDMFALEETVTAAESGGSGGSDAFGAFESAIAIGTQVGLAGSVDGLRSFLGDLASVTTPNATLVLDGYDPDADGTADLLGFRADPAPGLATRAFWFEYEGLVDPVLVFRLFAPDRLRAATIGTPWEVTAVRYPESEYYYVAALRRRSGSEA